MSDKGVFRTAPATPGLLINDEGVCRTAPATSGLFIISLLLVMNHINVVSLIGSTETYEEYYNYNVWFQKIITFR